MTSQSHRARLDWTFKFVMALILLSACAERSTYEPAEVEAAVEAAFRNFEQQLNAGDYEAALGFYSEQHFAAYEDGQLRYGSWEELRDVYSQLPSFGKGRFGYGEIEVVALRADRAWLATSFDTSFGDPGEPGAFRFSGAITALLGKNESGSWQILKIHSSSNREEPGR